MLKALHKNDTQLTPFIVTKDWELSNVTNEDLVLMEHTGSPGLPVALEYLEFTPYNPITASGCNIAQEQQLDDLVYLRDGLRQTGLFYPNTDPVNSDGTFKRVVYSQISNTFYNSYRDPTKIWGIEQIDFDKSKTQRFITDEFKLLNIPRVVFGEKIIENTVVMFDTTNDNNYTITDDGNCNLYAGTNLFSHQQELGEFVNSFYSGSFPYCDFYNTISPPDQPRMAVQYIQCFPPSVTVSWNVNGWLVSYYVVEKSLDGVTYNQTFNGLAYSYVDTNITYSNTYWYRMYAVNLLGTSSYSPTASIFAHPVTWDTDPDFWNSSSCGQTYWDTGSV